MHLSQTRRLKGPVTAGTACLVLTHLAAPTRHEKGPLWAALVSGYFQVHIMRLGALW